MILARGEVSPIPQIDEVLLDLALASLKAQDTQRGCHDARAANTRPRGERALLLRAPSAGSPLDSPDYGT